MEAIAPKPIERNSAVEEAHGFMFLTLDSDDSLLPDALEQVVAHWKAIPEDRRPDFAGIGGLLLEEDGTVSGTRYARDVNDSELAYALRTPASGMMKGFASPAVVLSQSRPLPMVGPSVPDVCGR